MQCDPTQPITTQQTINISLTKNEKEYWRVRNSTSFIIHLPFLPPVRTFLLSDAHRVCCLTRPSLTYYRYWLPEFLILRLKFVRSMFKIKWNFWWRWYESLSESVSGWVSEWERLWARQWVSQSLKDMIDIKLVFTLMCVCPQLERIGGYEMTGINARQGYPRDNRCFRSRQNYSFLSLKDRQQIDDRAPLLLFPLLS